MEESLPLSHQDFSVNDRFNIITTDNDQATARILNESYVY